MKLQPSPDGKRITAVGSKDWLVIDVAGGKEPIKFDGTRYNAISPDGTLIAEGVEGQCVIRDAATTNVRKQLAGKEGLSYQKLAFSEDGTCIAAIGVSKEESILYVWKIESGEKLLDVKTKAGGVTSDLQFSSPALFHRNLHESVSYDPASGKSTDVLLKAGDPVKAQIAPGGKRIIWSSTDDKIRICDYPSMEGVRELAVKDDSIACWGFSPNGDVIAVGLKSGKIQFLSAADGKEISPGR